MHSLLDMSVNLGYDSFKLHKNWSEVWIDKEYIFICYNFQACCIAGYRDITEGSELSEHPSYKGSLILVLPISRI